jgi:hypothetical protein
VPVWLLNTPLLKILRPGNDEGRQFLKQHKFQNGGGWQFWHTKVTPDFWLSLNVTPVGARAFCFKIAKKSMLSSA